jgi:LacI family xylobiose transport system transcriptional regulator
MAQEAARLVLRAREGASVSTRMDLATSLVVRNSTARLVDPAQA